MTRQGREALGRALAIVGAAIIASTIGTATASAQAPSPPKPLKTAVIVAKFQNDPTQIEGVEAGRARLFDGDRSVSAFLNEMSGGKLRLIGRDSAAGEVYGPVTIPFDNTATAPCSYHPWATAIKEAVTKSGVNLTEYDRFIYALPRLKMNCGWDGLGGGQNVWLNGTFDFGILAHEFGHTLDWAHAGLFKCGPAGARVALSAEPCEATNGGDPFELMGTGQQRVPSAFHLLRAGFLGLEQRQVVTQSGEYTISPMEPVAGPGTKMLRIPRNGNSAIDLEFRQPGGKWDKLTADDPTVKGVTARVSQLDGGVATKAGGKTYVVDTTPETESFSDSPLTPGRTLTDPFTGTTITTKSVGPEGAVVQVNLTGTPDVEPPTKPEVKARHGYSTPPGGPNVPMTLNFKSTDNVGVDKYLIYKNGALLTTTSETSYTDTAAKRREWTWYDIYAVDKAGGRSEKGAAVVYPQEPAYAPRVTADFAADGKTVTLDTVTRSDVSLNPTIFERDGKRVHGGGKPHTLVDTGVAPGTAYQYTVTGYTTAGEKGAVTTCEVKTPRQGETGSSRCTGEPMTPKAGAPTTRGKRTEESLDEKDGSRAFMGKDEESPVFFTRGDNVTALAVPTYCPGQDSLHSVVTPLPLKDKEERAQDDDDDDGGGNGDGGGNDDEGGGDEPGAEEPGADEEEEPGHSTEVEADGSFSFERRATQSFAPDDGSPEGTDRSTSITFEGDFRKGYKEATIEVTVQNPGCSEDPDTADPAPQPQTYRVKRVNNPSVALGAKKDGDRR